MWHPVIPHPVLFRLLEIKSRNWHRFLKSCGEVADAARRFWFPAKFVARVDEARGGTWEWTRLGSATGGGWVVNFLSATPVTSAKVTGPFITGANRSPVSRREAVLQVFRQHRNTSDRYSRPHRPATNGRRRLPRRPCRWNARVTTAASTTPRFKNRFRLDKSTISEKFVVPLSFSFHGSLKR